MNIEELLVQEIIEEIIQEVYDIYLVREKHIIKIQSKIRQFLYKINNLPNSIKYISLVLSKTNFKCSKLTNDGRTNSNLDEDMAIKILTGDNYLENRIYIPKPRHWFDICVRDYQYNWLPINIKSTTTLTADNTGNLACLVQSLTNEELIKEKSYTNGDMAKLFIKSLKNDNLNKKYKKDYYFLVIKKDSNDIYVNSLKGLSYLNPNINNLPFQIKWERNKEFRYKNVKIILKMVINTIKKPVISWRELFINEIRNIDVTIC